MIAQVSAMKMVAKSTSNVKSEENFKQNAKDLSRG